MAGNRGWTLLPIDDEFPFTTYLLNESIATSQHPVVLSTSGAPQHLIHHLSPLSTQTSSTMRPVPASAGSALRSWTRHTLPSSSSSSSRLAAPAFTSSSQRRQQSSEASGSSFQSPFVTHDTTKIPSFKAYQSKNSEVSNRVFSYFLAGSMGLLAAAGAKATVQGMWN